MDRGGIELLNSIKYGAYTKNINLICYVYFSSKIVVFRSVFRTAFSVFSVIIYYIA